MTYPHGGGDQIWRDGDDGHSHNPRKVEIRRWAGHVESKLDEFGKALSASDAALADIEGNATAARAAALAASGYKVGAEAARDAALAAVQYDYLVEDDTAKDALTGMTAGDRVYVRDTERVWRHDGVSWVDDGLAPTAGKADKDELDARIGYFSAPDLELAVDGSDSIYRRTAADGGLYIPGLDGSVQGEFADAKARSDYSPVGYSPSDVLNVADPAGRVILRLTDEGQIITPVGVQGVDSNYADTGVSLALGRSHFDSFDARSNGLLARLNNSGINPIAPCPNALLPGDFNITADLTNAYTVAQPPRLSINSPYFTDDMFVHPCLVEFANGFRGYQYWLTINPYQSSSAQFENPFVYGANDLSQFDLIPDMPQPLYEYGPGTDYNADVCFFYNPLTGELGVLWMRATDFGTHASLLARTTRDGTTWTEATTVFPSAHASVDRPVSPSLLYNPADGYWYLYTQHIAPALPASNIAREVRVRRSRNFNGPWGAYSVVATSPESQPWHIEFKVVGDKVIGLLANTYTGNLFLAQSTTDWMTFDTGTVGILTENEPCYKGTFTPVFNENDEMALRLMWTNFRGHSGITRWDVYTAQTNFVSIHGA